MCFSPIKLYNRKRLFRTGGDPAVLTIPCGKCAECLEQKQKDYIFRTWYEKQKFDRKYGENVRMFFLTLTFTKESVPVQVQELKYSYRENGCLKYSSDPDVLNKALHNNNKKFFANYDSPEIRRCMCVPDDFTYSDTHKFRLVPDYDMIEKFFKRLRIRLDRLPHFNFEISYLCATELGKEHFRPHYHLILIVGCNQPFSNYQFNQYIYDAWSIRKRFKDGRTGEFFYSSVPIGRIENDELFTDPVMQQKFGRRNNWQATAYVCKYVTKEFGRSDGDSKQSSRLRCSIGYGMPEFDDLRIPLPDFISTEEYEQGFKYLPIGDNGKPKKYLIPQPYYLRYKIHLKDCIQEFKKNASYVDDCRKYLFSDENPFKKYNIRCTATNFNVEDYLKHCKVDSLFNIRCKSFRLIQKADSYYQDLESAFLYKYQPHILKSFEDFYGISFNDLQNIYLVSDSDTVLDYVFNVRPFIYWHFKNIHNNLQAGFKNDDVNKSYVFPNRFFAYHSSLWSDVYDVSEYFGIEMLLTFVDFFRAYKKSIKEDLLIYNDKAIKAHINHLKTLKHYEEFISSCDTAGAMFSSNIVSSSKRWCDPFRKVWRDSIKSA